MRWIGLPAVLLVVLAGCADRGDPGAATADPGVATTDPGSTLQTTSLPSGVEGPMVGTSVYRIAASNLSYGHEVLGYRIVADGNATVEFTFDASVSTVTYAEDCLVFRARGSQVDSKAVVWSSNAQLEAKAQVAGQNVTVVPAQFPDDTAGAGPVSLHGSGKQALRQGESILFGLGGSRPWYAGSEGSSATLQLVVTGPARIVDLPPIPILCGSGSRQASGATAGAAGFNQDASVGGRVAFTSDNGTTFVAVGAFGDQAQVHVEIGGNSHPIGQDLQELNATGAGVSTLVFEKWSGFPDRLGWLFVAQDWSAQG